MPNDVQRALEEMRKKKGATNDVQAALEQIRAKKKPSLREQLAARKAKQEPSYGQTFAAGLEAGGQQTVESLVERGKQFSDIYKQTVSGEINPLQTGVRSVGTAIGTGFDVISGGVKGLYKALTPDKTEKAIAGAGKAALDTPAGQAALKMLASGVVAYEDWKAQHPELAKDLEATANIAAVLPVEKAVSAGAKGLSKLARGAGEAIETAAKGTARGVSSAAAKLPGADMLKAGGEIIKAKAKNIPVNAKAAQEAAKEIVEATPAVRGAALRGVPIRTAKIVSEAAPESKKVLSDMVNQAKTYAKGGTDILPQDVAGREMRRQIAEGYKVRDVAGARVAEEAAKLKGVQLPVRQKALLEMQQVKGLEGLKINNKGKLDFSDTILSSELADADKKIIEKVFSEIAGADASKVNQQRQFIFEYLGGKKLSSNTPVIETADKALEAMRKGMANAIEDVSPGYKAANQAYAKTAEPLQLLRRFFKTVEGADADLLEAHAGTLMRRLTSEAPSRTEIAQALRDLNQVLLEAGQKPGADLTLLMEFSAELGKAVPELVRETSHAGSVATGITKSGGLMGMMNKAAGDVAERAIGTSPEVRLRALEDLLR